MEVPESKKRKLSEWLDDLQQRSWELELLVSGFAIYGLFEAKPYINEVTHFLIASDSLALFIGALISTSLPLAWYVFVSNLIIHVFVRGLWIGSLGLRYVSGDIDYDTLEYNDRFKNYYQKKYGSFDNFIERLEKISSIIFSVTFLIFFIFLSILIYIGLLVFLVNQFSNSDHFILIKIVGIIFFALLLISGLLILIDFCTIGKLKKVKNKWFTAFYFPLNRITSMLTLSILWRPLLLNFLDDKFSRRVLFLSIPYAILVSILLPNLFSEADIFHPNFDKDTRHYQSISTESYNYYYYEDELKHIRKEHDQIELQPILLTSKTIKGDIMQVFVKSHPLDKELIQHFYSDATPLYQSGIRNTTLESIIKGYRSESHKDSSAFNTITADDLNQDQYVTNLKNIKKTLGKVMEFSINEDVVTRERLSCDFYVHPTTQTKGMLCILTLDSLSSGRNHITFKRLLGSKSEDMPLEQTELTIPFIYEN